MTNREVFCIIIGVGVFPGGRRFMYLKDVNTGESCTVVSLSLPFELERRLEALGMTRGTRLGVLNRKGKGIMIIKLRGTRFALGYNITRNIEVEGVGSDAE